MTRTSKTITVIKQKTARREGLRKMLTDRRRLLQTEVRSRLKEISTAGQGSVQPSEDGEADIQQDVELAVIQMRSEMFRQIEAALARMESGGYGDCISCGEEIPTRRLQVLPFAARCTACEDARERSRALATPHGRSGDGASYSEGSGY